MKTFSNISELEQHLNKKFKGMMKSQEMKEAGKRASRAMGRYVEDQLSDGGASGYNYEQSGSFHSLIREESKAGDVFQSATSMVMGMGELDNMNMGVWSRRNYQEQDHATSRGVIRIRLKEEKQMPKWIIAEFGAGSKKIGSVPPEFKIHYTPRADKNIMYGPSIRNVKGVDGGSKRGFFMINREGMNRMSGDPSFARDGHPGIKPGRIFSRGLKASQQEVRDILADGISDFLNNN